MTAALLLPGEAELAATASLVDRQHVRVRRAGEHQLPDFERSGHAESATLSGTVEPLDSLDAAGHVSRSDLPRSDCGLG